ncbi:hypothetical protein HW555_009948 [Spodoptera exigua]|uniref:Vacuolar protein sorting-associated protein 13D n=1 Tax=Spodoptera exigua TaxID=7107 RepID=A0A835L688_SPOEX|nr:hypothetical protein HW555_009948 [Spodoptera exigua]
MGECDDLFHECCCQIQTSKILCNNILNCRTKFITASPKRDIISAIKDDNNNRGVRSMTNIGVFKAKVNRKTVVEQRPRCTMLEGLVAWVLNNYLGKYVENLNTDQLSVALLSGKVELENLPLKKDALRHLGLPVEIKAGFIGKVQLQVPVRQIRSAPWLIAIEKLYLVAAPINLDEWDSSVEASIAHERKTALLDALEAQWRAEHEAADAGYYATSYSSWLSYGTGLLANIVENLQLKLNDVHIRYEDAVTCARPFACGLTVESLCAESCDSEWRRGFTLLSDPDGCSFKLLELYHLAVYWDPMPVPTGMFASCTIAELTRQYNEAVCCAAGLERLARVREFRARRPAAPVRGHARDWWLYALSCHIPDHRWTEPKPTWESCLERSRQSRQYVAACLVTLSNPAATLPADRKAAKDEFEWRTPLPLLKALREVAMRKVPKSSPASTPDKPGSSGRSMLVHWFPQWWGWYADSLDNNTMLKRDTVFGKFEFILNKGSLNLCMETEADEDKGVPEAAEGSEGAEGVELQFSCVRVGIESRPRAASHALHVSLGAVCLRERITPNTLFPILIAPQVTITRDTHGVIREGLSSLSASGAAMAWCRAHSQAGASIPHSQQEPLFQLTYEKKPFGMNCDYKVRRLVTECVVCPQAVGEVSVAGGGGERRTWQVELDISAPQILFVEELCSRDSAVLVVDFGRLRLANANLAECAPHTPPDDEEMFMTPCSTPPGSLLSPSSPPDPPPQNQAQPALDATNLHNRLYDRYTARCCTARSGGAVPANPARPVQVQDRAERPADPGGARARQLEVRAHQEYLLAAPAGPVQHPAAGGAARGADQRPAVPVGHRVRLVAGAGRAPQRAQARPRAGQPRAGAGGRRGGEQRELGDGALGAVAAPQLDAVHAAVRDRADVAGGAVHGAQHRGGAGGLASPDARGARGPHGLAHPHALHQALNSLHYNRQESQCPTEPTDPGRASPAPSWMSGTGFNWNGSSMFGADWGTWSGANWGPTATNWGAAGLVDSEALIAVDLCIVKGDADSEDLRIANILFNNLDIIANQETIVELIGFTQRVMGPKTAPKKQSTESNQSEPAAAAAYSYPAPEDEPKRSVRTEITFDFHRLGVLLLRAALHDGALVARKIATATISEARIQATVGRGGRALAEPRLCADGSRVEVGGSLGGVGVVSLCEGGGLHTRVLAAGQAGRADAADAEDAKALQFSIARQLREGAVEASVALHVASVWYTHSGPLLRELRSCLTEFKQYLANLARSIRAAAADMAIGLVHPRGESLYVNPKLSQSTEGVSPRRRTVSLGASLDEPAALKADNIAAPPQPWRRWRAAADGGPCCSVSIELESPVVVVPRHAHSTQVFVAHLGRMSLSNRPGAPRRTRYKVRVRDISLASLDPVLHNTALRLSINYCDPAAGSDADYQCEVHGRVVGGLHVSARREQYEQLLETLRWVSSETPDVADSGSPAGPQRAAGALLEGAVRTLQLDPAVRAAVLAVPPPPARAPPAPLAPLTVNFELPTFSVELRADLGEGERSLVELSFREFKLKYQKTHPYENMLQVSLHSITMEDLTKEPDSKHRMLMVSHTPQMPPKAVFVSKSCPDFVTEYPDDMSSVSSLQYMKWCSCSLPSQLNVLTRESKERRNKRDSKCAPTPPCSPECGAPSPAPAAPRPTADPAEHSDPADPIDAADPAESTDPSDNLVWLSVHTRDPHHPQFADKYDKISKLIKVDFNCLNLVVSIDSWVAVLDFFGIAGDDATDGQHGPEPPSTGRYGDKTAGGARGSGVSRARGACREGGGRRGRRVLADGGVGAYQRLSSAEAAAAGHETSLSIEMGPVTYVHTKRFVQELQAFARDFSLLRKVIMQARLKVSVVSGGSGTDGARPARMKLNVRCTAPVIVLPVSGRARNALAAHLDQLTLDNSFKYAGSEGGGALLDVRSVRLAGVALWCARGGRGLRVRRRGAPLLRAPADLRLRIEYNMDAGHAVPDMTVQGSLSTLQLALDPAQYRLVRGVLAHNLAECVDDLLPRDLPHHQPEPQHQDVWTTSSLKLDLHDVTVKLEPEHGVSSLACINFIKSRLVVETYSDLSQDIDLVSQEILVSDTRFAKEPANRRGNVFSHIVQPMAEQRHSVQAEVHARKRRDSSAYTILVNNMRLMAVLDWWECANQFIMQPPPPPADPDQAHLEEALCAMRNAASPHPAKAQEEPLMELKLNVTDSQLVLVEDPSVWDTNAVILRSTTVITYRCADAQKPVSCELNELEVFSCVLGLEEETALSIVDPAAVHVAIDAQRVLHVAMSTLNLRLSYHDMRMFAAMLQSLPVQARAALAGKLLVSEEDADEPANILIHRIIMSLRTVDGRARLARAVVEWLSGCVAAQVAADCITLCVIDDCLDSDVPLLEVSLSDLHVDQFLQNTCIDKKSISAGNILNLLIRFETSWEYTLTSELSLGRVQVEVASTEVLNTNVTSSLIELAELSSATQEQSPKGSPSGHRRRSPFVPYALRNHTGHRLLFTTLVTTSDELREQTSCSEPDDSWMMNAALNQLALRLDGWSPPDPVCVDRVGVFFRNLTHTVSRSCDVSGVVTSIAWMSLNELHSYLQKSGAEARIVFEVSLEGSARKLVTVRSALQLVNKLPHPVEVRVDHAPSAGETYMRLALGCEVGAPVVGRTMDNIGAPMLRAAAWSGGSVRTAQVGAGATWAAPLSAQPAALWTRPLLRAQAAPPAPSPAPIDWRNAPGDRALLHYECRAPPDHVYRFCCVIVRERFPPDRGTPIAGHTLTLVPALRLENLLPLELQYRACPAVPGTTTVSASGNIPPGDTMPFHECTPQAAGLPRQEAVPQRQGHRQENRRHQGYCSCIIPYGRFGAKLKRMSQVSISAAYWLVNHTGLPLVFRAEGGATEAAGQFDEHELARMVQPLLFSFAEADGGPTISARIGRGLPGTPELHNNTSHHLQFAQKCCATTLTDPGAMATHVSAVAGCSLPWHWARWERPQLLEPGGGYQFVRVEVVSQGATMFVVLTDAECAPPAAHRQLLPRVHHVPPGRWRVGRAGRRRRQRWAAVSSSVAQVGCSEECVNFIYVAFSATHPTYSTGARPAQHADDDAVLVLEVPLGSTRVVLARKRYGDRSQLWRRGPNEQLIHEGSSPPQPTDVLLSDDAPLSPHAMPEGLSLMALTPGTRVVLGLPASGRAGWSPTSPVPAEQAVSWHTLRPGSGRLDVTLCADGPTRVVKIHDHKEPEAGWLEGGADAEEDTTARRRGWGEWGVRVSLAGLSVSLVSRAPPAELVHALFDAVLLELALQPRSLALALAVTHMQWDNQVSSLRMLCVRLVVACSVLLYLLLLGTPSPVLLYCLPERGGSAGGALPALHAAVELQRAPAKRYNAYFFKHLVVALRPLAIRLEER